MQAVFGASPASTGEVCMVVASNLSAREQRTKDPWQFARYAAATGGTPFPPQPRVMDSDGSGDVTLEEFVTGCMQLQAPTAS